MGIFSKWNVRLVVLFCGLGLCTSGFTDRSEPASEADLLRLYEGLLEFSYSQDYTPSLFLRGGGCFSPNGKYYAALATDGKSIYVVDRVNQSHSRVHTSDDPVGEVTVSPNGRYVFYCINPGKQDQPTDLVVHDRGTGKTTKCFDLRTHGGVNEISFSPDSKYACVITHGNYNTLPIILVVISTEDLSCKIINPAPTSGQTYHLISHSWRDNSRVMCCLRSSDDEEATDNEMYLGEFDIRDEFPVVERRPEYEGINQFLAEVALEKSGSLLHLRDAVWDPEGERFAFFFLAFGAKPIGLYIHDMGTEKTEYFGRLWYDDLVWPEKNALYFLSFSESTNCQPYKLNLELE